GSCNEEGTCRDCRDGVCNSGSRRRVHIWMDALRRQPDSRSGRPKNRRARAEQVLSVCRQEFHCGAVQRLHVARHVCGSRHCIHSSEGQRNPASSLVLRSRDEYELPQFERCARACGGSDGRCRGCRHGKLRRLRHGEVGTLFAGRPIPQILFGRGGRVIGWTAARYFQWSGNCRAWVAVVSAIFFSLALALSCTSVQAQESGAAESSSSSSPDASATAPDRPRLSYSQLADTLENPAARDKLVEQLRTLAEAEAAQAEEAPVQDRK